jgi:hypothetical protein
MVGRLWTGQWAMVVLSVMGILPLAVLTTWCIMALAPAGVNAIVREARARPRAALWRVGRRSGPSGRPGRRRRDVAGLGAAAGHSPQVYRVPQVYRRGVPMGK